MNTAPSVAIVVLQYNHSEDTVRCLESLRALTYSNFNVIVVDNASVVEHLKHIEYWIKFNKFKNFKLIANNSNDGYSGGNNVGVREALKQSAEYVLILNNDVMVSPNFLEKMLEVKADIVGVEWGTGIIAHTYLVGYALLIACRVFEKIGLFDERYFLYYDEVEFCTRAQKAGFQLGVARAEFHHAVSASTKSLGAAQLLYYHRRNALLFYNAYGPWYVIIALPFWKYFVILKQHIKILLGRDIEISQAILQGVHDYDQHRFGMRIN